MDLISLYADMLGSDADSFDFPRSMETGPADTIEVKFVSGPQRCRRGSNWLVSIALRTT